MTIKRNRRTVSVALLLATAAAIAGTQVEGAGGQPPSSALATPLPGAPVRGPETTARLDHSLLSCSASFTHYWLGQSFNGLSLATEIRQCTDPEPARSLAAGGGIDPNSLGRTHMVTDIYGDCNAASEGACAPPLQVHSWPACELSPSDITMGGETRQPDAVTQIRGVPARFYDDQNHLMLSTGDVTVVIAGSPRSLLAAAAEALRTTAGSTVQVGAGDALPSPVPGAQEGTLACGQAP